MAKFAAVIDYACSTAASFENNEAISPGHLSGEDDEQYRTMLKGIDIELKRLVAGCNLPESMKTGALEALLACNHAICTDLLIGGATKLEPKYHMDIKLMPGYHSFHVKLYRRSFC